MENNSQYADLSMRIDTLLNMISDFNEKYHTLKQNFDILQYSCELLQSDNTLLKASVNELKTICQKYSNLFDYEFDERTKQSISIQQMMAIEDIILDSDSMQQKVMKIINSLSNIKRFNSNMHDNIPCYLYLYIPKAIKTKQDSELFVEYMNSSIQDILTDCKTEMTYTIINRNCISNPYFFSVVRHLMETTEFDLIEEYAKLLADNESCFYTLVLNILSILPYNAEYEGNIIKYIDLFTKNEQNSKFLYEIAINKQYEAIKTFLTVK